MQRSRESFQVIETAAGAAPKPSGVAGWILVIACWVKMCDEKQERSGEVYILFLSTPATLSRVSMLLFAARSWNRHSVVLQLCKATRQEEAHDVMIEKFLEASGAEGHGHLPFLFGVDLRNIGVVNNR